MSLYHKPGKDTAHVRICGLLFFVSGSAALVYQVLWVRALGLLFGGTAQAAAVTIAIFFAGIAAGGAYWGRRAARTRHALRTFGALEIAVAITALAFFSLIMAYHAIYPHMHSVMGGHPYLDVLLKSTVAATILFPSAFLMGGTLPMMGEHVVRFAGELGRKGSWLYALNTLGGAVGALSAGFILPVWLGFRGAYLLAAGLDLTVGLSALWLARGKSAVTSEYNASDTERKVPVKAFSIPLETVQFPTSMIWSTAFLSGFAALGMEVIWTRLFAQVLQNSVYTYALVLVTFLSALALGATLANMCCRISRIPGEILLLVLLGLSGVMAALSPWIFYSITGGMGYVGAGADWYSYLRNVAWAVALVMLIPGAVMGAVLPFLLRLLQSSMSSPGHVLGRLIAINTTGAIIGALASGFILLPWLGATRSLWALASLYLCITAVVWAVRTTTMPRRGLAVAMAVSALAMPALPITPMQVVNLNTERNERLIDWIEGPHATAAVIERDGHRLIRVNNHYTLGGTGALESERNQAVIPMLLHPEPDSIFFLGMGTGITAGAALLFPVEEVVVAEILPEVIELARTYFEPWTEGLFTDPRVTIYADDGRNLLARSSRSYDLIISDLFTPWKAGTGNLYTREHFETAGNRLEPGGMFVQWIPTYQVSRKEFGIIARTMDEVFDQVVLWRGDLFPRQSIVALIGQNEARPLDPAIPVVHGRRLAGRPYMPAEFPAASALRFYAGNITVSGLFDSYPLNTDNFPRIEYQAPRTQREVQAGRTRWLTGDQLGILYEELLRRPGLERDPYLEKLSPVELGYILAGRSYFNYGIYRMAGRMHEARWFLEDFVDRMPFNEPPPDIEPPTTLSDWEE